MKSEWIKTKLSEFVNINPRRSIKKGTMTPFVAMTDLVENVRDIPTKTIKAFGSGTKFIDGDTLFARITPCLENGKTALVSGLGEGVIAAGSTEFIVLNPKHLETDKYFVYYLARLPELRRYAERKMEGTSGRQRVSAQSLGDFEFMLPPPDERKKIGQMLADLDDKISSNTKMNAVLERITRRLFKSWFVNFDPVHANTENIRFGNISLDLQSLFPNELVDSKIGSIPKGWTVSEIGDEVQCVGGSTPSTSKSEYWENGSVLWTTPKDLSSQESKVMIDTSRKITSKGLTKVSSGLLPVNTVLMSSRAPVGYLAISKEPVSINQGYIAMKCNKSLGPMYILNWLEENMENIKQHAGGTTFAEISKKSFRPLPVLVPSQPVIAKYEEIAGNIYERIESNARQNECLRGIRNRLLPRLIYGTLPIKSECKAA